MQDFMTYIFTSLTKYPYRTLFDLITWGNTTLPVFNLATDFTYHFTQVTADYGPLDSYSYADLSYTWWDDNWLYVVYIGKFRVLAGGIYYYFAVGVKYLILETSEGGMYFSGGGDINIDTYLIGTQLPDQEEYWFTDLAGGSKVSLLFPEDEIDTINKITVPNGSAGAIAIQIHGILFTVYTPVPTDYPPDIIRTITLSSEVFQTVGEDLYQECVSFNTEMAILDVIRLACLTTSNFLVSDGYSLRFKNIDLVNITNPRLISYYEAVSHTFRPFIGEKEIKDFDEIEAVTLWKDDDDDNSKYLKPKLKNKLRYLTQTASRIEFEYDWNIAWGEFIKIINHPRQEKFQFKIFFVYDAEKRKDTTKVKAFWVKSAELRSI